MNYDTIHSPERLQDFMLVVKDKINTKRTEIDELCNQRDTIIDKISIAESELSEYHKDLSQINKRYWYLMATMYSR